MKRVKMGIAMASLFIIFICGCQPTPEKTAVVYGGGLEEKLQGSPAPFGAYDAPVSWQETLDMKGNDTKVEINASISVPDVTVFPVYKVKQTEFNDFAHQTFGGLFRKRQRCHKDQGTNKR